MDNFELPSFWTDRYSKQQGLSFDWLESYKQLRLILLKDVLSIYPLLQNCHSEQHQQNLIYDDSKLVQALDIGCGNSTFTEQMHD